MTLRRTCILIVLAACGCRAPQPVPQLVMATTTSVGNSGLLDALLPAFHARSGIQVRSHLVGSGLALQMLLKGDADIVISHAPAAETTALEEHTRWRYRKIMFNDFVLAGPLDDPARVRGAATVDEAMRRIAASRATFLSRGDQSGTHEREEALWRLAGSRPAPGRLVVAGSGMGTTLRVASETAAYTLTDRATFAQHENSLNLAVLFKGGTALVNSYAVLFDPEGANAKLAAEFYDWITSTDGHRAISAYRIGDLRPFTPWPPERSADGPNDLPVDGSRQLRYR